MQNALLADPLEILEQAHDSIAHSTTARGAVGRPLNEAGAAAAGLNHAFTPSKALQAAIKIARTTVNRA